MKGYCKPCALLILFCCALPLAGSDAAPLADDEPYVVQGYRVPFEMQVPLGWIVDLGTGGDLVLGVFRPKSDEDPQPLYPFISTTMEYGRMLKHRTPEDVLTEHVMNHPDTIVASKEWRSLENTEALMARVSWSSPFGRIESLKAIVNVDEHVLVISCVSLASEFETYEPIFMECLDSLKQKRPPEIEESAEEEDGGVSNGGAIDEIY